MSAREPGDPRCKDCPEPHEPGRVRCEPCAELHRKAAAEARSKRVKSKRCVVCGKATAAGTTLCGTHRTYYRDRAETRAREVLK